MHQKRAWRILGILKKVSQVEFCLGKPCGRCCTWFGADGKVSIEKWYLSPDVEKPLNSKVIKSFVPELRSRKCFFVFRDSYVLCIYVMNILSTFHIFMYGYVTSAVFWDGKIHYILGFLFFC